MAALFYTLSYGYGKKKSGKRLSHLVLFDNAVFGVQKKTVCGLLVGNQGALWAFTDASFVPSLFKGSTEQSKRDAVYYHITCKNCLRGYSV